MLLVPLFTIKKVEHKNKNKNKDKGQKQDKLVIGLWCNASLFAWWVVGGRKYFVPADGASLAAAEAVLCLVVYGQKFGEVGRSLACRRHCLRVAVQACAFVK